MSDALTTQALIGRAKAGEREAVEEICSRYQARVLAAVRARMGKGLRRKLESCDVVQEAMLDAVRGIDGFEFRSEGAFLKYINQIVSNRLRDANDFWKAQCRDVDKEMAARGDSKSAIPPEALLAEKGMPTPSRICSLSEDMDQLIRALNIIGEKSEEDRELIIAIKLECQTYGEVAEELGISPDAVRMRCNRVLDALDSVFRSLSPE